MKYYVVNENHQIISEHIDRESAVVAHQALWKAGADVEIHSQERRDEHARWIESNRKRREKFAARRAAEALLEESNNV